ncbi:MAG TPA: aldo/keto reductase [Nocardioidaceae bacterium]|nr:aldo/keto reductase [Nocardioidaceae bacterium]
MTHTTLSPTLTLHDDVAIPQLGFGVYQVSGAQVGPAVTAAVEAGYRHIDTAKLYRNEEEVGDAVRGAGVPRQDVFVTTKLWGDDHGYDAARRGFDASLGRLGLEYVDLYLIHWPSPEDDLNVETWRALERIRADGLTRAIGVSNFGADQLRRLADEGDVLPSINQVQLHPTMQQDGLRSVHEEMGVVTEAWAPLGKARDLDDPVVREIADQTGRTPAQVVLRWHLQLGNVAIPKSVTPERIRENFAVFDFELSDDAMAQLARIDSA